MSKSANQIRQEFIDFFTSKDHRFVPSAPVIPQDDPSLLFANAGMNQFKSIFLGENRENLKRVVNSQKCMRVSGKHNDLEEVGVDHHHHTFFEMLGNWSFGDYYKKEAIAWAWELLTKVWGLPKDKLYATVYNDDTQAEKIWKKATDIDHSHISRHGAKDNFWEMGETGPCGPCSEIHLDSGPGTCVNENNPGHTCAINADGCGRFIEIWNLVFIQFNRGRDSSLFELPKKHVDTGMGFERIVRIIQNVSSNYDTDIFSPIIKEIENSCGQKYDPGKEGTPFRVIADHIRALVFAVTDGAFPSNEGRGYVLRRLLRRAYRFGRNLGFAEPFLHTLVPTVIDTMRDAFPELDERREYVVQVIRSEEERFDQTLELGLEKMNQMTEKNLAAKQKTLPGADVFTLYDTYGFPMDLTRLIAAEHGLTINEDEFEKLMQSQKRRAREAAKADSGNYLTAENWIDLKEISQTEFVGFDSHEVEVTVCRYKIIDPIDTSNVCKNGLVVLDKTPFYAEMGGQVGDTGTLQAEDGTIIEVIDTIKWNDITVHKVTAESEFSTKLFNKPFIARIHEELRSYTKRNHTATHLLQSALKETLGGHVSQSGSLVDPETLRFDFTHFQALTPEEIRQVDDLVNEWILADLPLTAEMKETEKAKKEGAIALFGEKYDDTVRVISIGSISKELCGGTHVNSTGNIGLFHITSESSIAAGMRRIEAVTGVNSIKYLREKEAITSQLASTLKVQEDKLIERVTDQSAKLKNLESKFAKESKEQIAQMVETMLKKVNKKGKFPWIVENLGTIDKSKFVELLNAVSDTIRKKQLDTTVVFFTADVGGNALFAASAGEKAVSNYNIHCGDLVNKAASICEGSGGGSPVRAQAGGKRAEDIQRAVEEITTEIKEKAGK
jgi:alanyl-tRNA synthetase